MKYKAIILDLDGTTIPLGIDSHPSVRVLETIGLAQKQTHVCVATGRPLFIAKRVIKELGLNSLCSVHDSTQLYNAADDTIIDTISLDHGIADQAYRIIKQYKPEVVLIGEGEKEYEYTGGPWPDTLTDIAMPDLSESTVDKLIEHLTKIQGIAVHKNPSFKKGLFWASVSNALATKLHAVVRIAELLKIRTDEIIGVGDSYNDYPLLSACGLKIAMGNAVPQLKAIADFIAPSVDEDGVATVIEKFILS
ncbi:MAG: HAD family hydrolase [Candidatus Gottesmanbacteria bacterium]|nr:HAD family hydrolase [Candidatus Gottesmanbacteria bacterium]